MNIFMYIHIFVPKKYDRSASPDAGESMGGLELWFGGECPVESWLRSGAEDSPGIGATGPQEVDWMRRVSPFQERVLGCELLFGAVESQVGFWGLLRCRGMGDRCCEPTALGCASLLYNLLSSKRSLGVAS